MSGAQSSTRDADPIVAACAARVGRVLRQKWRLDRLLGVGGMAAVYAATHRNASRAAVKVLHRELSGEHHFRTRFLKEGYLANKVDHPGVVRVLDDDVAEDGSLFLVMELLDGESLEQRRERMGGRLDADEVLAVADQLLDVLAAAHQKGIIHRDIKPDNVFLTRDGAVKVLDFGIARLRELSAASQVTKAGTTMGTPAYMAPEHARGLWDQVDARSDLFSAGATLFQLLTGQRVHRGRTTNEELLAAMSSRATPIASVLPGISPLVAEVVDKSLAFESGDRYPDAATMQDAVRRAYHAAHGAPISSRPLVVPESVPDKTLPSADVAGGSALGAATTGAAVSRGRTGIALASRITPPRALVLIIAAAGVLGVIAVVAVVVALRGRRPVAERSGAQPSSVAPLRAAAAPAPPAAPGSEGTAPEASTQRPVPASAPPLASARAPRKPARRRTAVRIERPPAATTTKPRPKPAAPGLLGSQNW